jgi:general secretion pathway protein G
MIPSHPSPDSRYPLRRRRRFSLIEILVVIAIIGMAMAMVVPNLIGAGEGAKWDLTQAEIQVIKGAVMKYYLDMNQYPSSLEDLINDPGSNKWRGSYLEDKVIPKDKWDREYEYRSPGDDGRPFEIVSFGADGQSGGEKFDADITSWKEPE